MTSDKNQAAIDFSSRLSSALDEIEYPQKGRAAKLARHFGVKPPSVFGWFNGLSVPESERVHELARMTGVSFEWLKWGQGPRARSTNVPESGELLAILERAIYAASQHAGLIDAVPAEFNATHALTLCHQLGTRAAVKTEGNPNRPLPEAVVRKLLSRALPPESLSLEALLQHAALAALSLTKAEAKA